jgi:ADP-ribosylglycohydrolase
MWGNIIGDIVGSQFEFSNIHNTDFELFSKNKCSFTDDTVCTIAIMDAILKNEGNDFQTPLREWCIKYPEAGYGRKFLDWLANSDLSPMDSYGNGCCMRVSPCAYVYEGLQDTIDFALKSCKASHIHPEALKGTSAITHTIWLAKNNYGKTQIKQQIEGEYTYNLDLHVDEIRKQNNIFNSTCQVTVPQAIYAFLFSDSFEDCLRIAISFGGDCDTIAAMACSIAEAYYGDIPINLIHDAKQYLPKCMVDIVESYYMKYVKI